MKGLRGKPGVAMRSVAKATVLGHGIRVVMPHVVPVLLRSVVMLTAVAELMMVLGQVALLVHPAGNHHVVLLAEVSLVVFTD